jgi:hypothetical protein
MWPKPKLATKLQLHVRIKMAGEAKRGLPSQTKLREVYSVL